MRLSKANAVRATIVFSLMLFAFGIGYGLGVLHAISVVAEKGQEILQDPEVMQKVIGWLQKYQDDPNLSNLIVRYIG